eukprot:TRINITY_DN87_c0_g1_i2.p1 TRINITY_DN87_c0_g1~~TRINITY_DN87_c0_g1_i2.p1  ORF type:complete len:125 (+),score=23.37 TRINITY_DN87_c0_g1_i2:1-375(+)
MEKDICKVILLGETEVGKTCIVNRFVDNKFNKTSVTIGASFFARNLIIEENVLVKLRIWDTAGQEKYRCLIPMYYKGSSAAIVVFDLTNQESFEACKNYWINEIKKHGKNQLFTPFLISTNKQK